MAVAIAISFYWILPHPLFEPLAPDTSQDIARISDIEHLRQSAQFLVVMHNELTQDASGILDSAIDVILYCVGLAALILLISAWKLRRLLRSDDEAS